MEWTPFIEIAAVLTLSAAIGAIGLKLRQPLIISFLLAGILVGPSILGLITETHSINLFASIGISLLLFVVGLRLDIGMIRTVGPVALATGLGQVVFTFLIGLAIAFAFGMSVTISIYVAVALTFSSTIIIVKLLSDKKEIDSLHGRIAVGFLIVQDIAAILALIGLTAFGSDHQGQGVFAQSLWIVTKGIAMIGAIAVLMRWVLPGLLKHIVQSPELLVLMAITWAVLLSATSELLGFSKEVGAFLAGLSLASTEQRDAIGARLSSVRDFLLIFFFIDLGANLNISSLQAEIGKAVVFSLFVLIGNPLIVMAIMGAMGYRKRTGFMSGLAVAQISEFSLILAAMGLSLGHIDSSAMSLITMVGLITIFASTYMILYSGPLYSMLSGVLGIFERANPYREVKENAELAPADDNLIILMGLGNYGTAIATHLQQQRWNLLAVDFDPQALERGRKLGVSVSYGDVGDTETLTQLPFDKAQWVLCAIRDHVINESLAHLLHERNFSGNLALTASNPAQAEEYRQIGAHLVFQPFHDAAEQAVEAVTGTIQSLGGLKDWPANLEEVSLQSGSVFSGKTLRELGLRGELGVSVLAVNRAGKTHFNPSPDFRMFPGDRIVLLCPPEHSAKAIAHLRQRELRTPYEQSLAFNADEIHIPQNSQWVGKSLAELDLRNRYGVTVIGIRRQETPITSLRASDKLLTDDSIIVVGSPEGITEMKTIQDSLNR